MFRSFMPEPEADHRSLAFLNTRERDYIMRETTGRIITLLIAGMILCPLHSPVSQAQARDVFEDAHPGLLSLRQCSHEANAATFLTQLDQPDDTLVVLIVDKGEGGVVKISDTGIRYAFTYADCNASQAALSAPGQISIRFVDAKAPGFVVDVPTTWKYKSIQSVHIEATWDPGTTCTRNDPDTGSVVAKPYFGVQAYKAFKHAGELNGTTSTQGSWTRYDFPGSAGGVKDVYIHTDFCRNELRNLVIRNSTAP
jgi:hypothetical protein